MSSNCQFPFGYVSISPQGISPCCLTSPLVPTSKASDSFYLEKPWQDLRKALLSKERPTICNACWDCETKDKVSLRERIGQALFTESIDELNENLHPRFLELVLDRVCPLACRMCNSKNSTGWDKLFAALNENRDGFTKESWMQLSNDQLIQKSDQLMTRSHNFWNLMQSLLKTAKSVNLSGGEPLSHPDHRKLLDCFCEYDVSLLNYYTSLNHPTAKIKALADRWKQIDRVNFKVSADDVGEQYNQIRIGGDFNLVLENILLLRSQGFSVQIGVVVQAYNIKNLNGILEFWREQSIDVLLKPMDGPDFLKSPVYPAQVRSKIVNELSEILKIDALSPMNRYVLESELTRLQTNDFSEYWSDYLHFNDVVDSFAENNA